jgi:hypothetical protein
MIILFAESLPAGRQEWDSPSTQLYSVAYNRSRHRLAFRSAERNMLRRSNPPRE